MSLDKAIKHGKEHRKPYTGSKVYFVSCRNHGGCPWCEENRKHKFRDKHPCDLFLGQSDWDYPDDFEPHLKAYSATGSMPDLESGDIGSNPIALAISIKITGEKSP